jgi:hypothetical protein
MVEGPELFSEVCFFVGSVAVDHFEVGQSSFGQFCPLASVNQQCTFFTSSPRSNGLMRQHSVFQPHEISASVEPMDRFGCAEVAALPTRERLYCDYFRHSLLPHRCRQRALKFLGWNACSRPLLPGHLWTAFSVDPNELLLGRSSGELE